MRRQYINRYGDKFTFSLNKDKDILWKGDFKHCRFSWPNDYTKAYQAYLDDRESVDEEKILSLEEFSSDVHVYQDGKHLYPEYVRLVESITDQISMVDPSGGPYICRSMSLDSFGFKGAIVEDFKPIKGGYKIITKKCPYCDQKAGIHKFSCDTKRIIINIKNKS